MRVSNFFHVLLFAFALILPRIVGAGERQWVCVTNEKSGTVTIIDPASRQVIDTIAVGKRPRGIHPSPDGRTLYVALSGRPIEGPPQLDAKGNPIFNRDEDEDEKNSDHAADGIGVIDLTSRKFVKKLPAGSDPEEFAVSPDGRHLCIANEDVATASLASIESGKVEKIVVLKQEPEGVAYAPGGKRIFVSCETNGDIFAIEADTFQVVGHFSVPPRPRSITFLPDGSLMYVPSESSGQLSVADPVACKVLRTLQLPAGSRPMGMVTDHAGKKLYITTGRGGTVLVLDTSTLEVLQTIRVGKRPWGIAISADDKWLYVANGPSNDISVIDLSSEQEVARIPAGESPWGVAVVTLPEP